MPRTVIRQFTGGISNEIDPQNLRDDQGETALDINLKGYALEPGEGTAPLADGGHYYYRGEWIRDSKAISFEESGIGVVKTFDDKRPQFEEIIKDDANTARNLGPALPPSAAISGTVVSEGTRGERPAEGSHLLKLPATALGEVDKIVGSVAAPSLKTHQADVSTNLNHIHYYNGQPYWIEDSGTNWRVKTRGLNTDGTFSATLFVMSANLSYYSGGSFFKEGHFVCWDHQRIVTVPLSPSSMTPAVINTIDTTDGGDAGSNFSANAGTLTTATATANEITGVDINNGIVSFSQKITTGNTVPTEYDGSANERWMKMPSGTKGCFVVFLRDGMPWSASESNATGAYNESDEDTKFEVYTDKNTDQFPGWTTPSDYFHHPQENHRKEFSRTYGKRDYGFKYAVVYANNDSWVRVKYIGTKYPEIFVLNDAMPRAMNHLSTGFRDLFSRNTIKKIKATRTWQQTLVWSGNKKVSDGGYPAYLDFLYRDSINVELVFPSMVGTKGNKIQWHFTAPTSIWAIGGKASMPASSRERKWDPWNSNNWIPLSRLDRTWDIGSSQIGGGTSNTSPGATNVDAGSWARWLGASGSNTTNFISARKSSASLGRNNITSPNVPGKTHRLCSFTPGGAMTLKAGFGVSKLWTTATIASADNSITFPEVNTTNFRVGDYIKIGVNGSNQSIHLNLPFNKTYISYRITEITGTKLKLFLPNGKKLIDEVCYPVISTFVTQTFSPWVATDSGGPTCKVIQTGLSSHVLVGHSTGRYRNGSNSDVIEVRDAGGAVIPTNLDANRVHNIDWNGKDVKAVTQTTTGLPRVFYTKLVKGVRHLFSQNGSDNTSPASVILTTNGTYNVDKNYLTHVDDSNITVYTPSLGRQFLKAKPDLPEGLGLTGKVTDGRTFVTTSNAVYVFAKIGGYWKLVKTGTKPESSLLSYDFKEPLAYDDVFNTIWGIGSDSTSGWDIQTATPLYESSIVGSWINHVDSGTSAWGQVLKTRLGSAEDNGKPRYLSVDWMMDSGVVQTTGDPTIGLNHEPNKMVGVENTFSWYPIDRPKNSSGALALIDSSNQGTVITDPKLVINFDSRVIRDVVFFKASETVLPASGDTGGEAKITFNNYQDSGQSFYVLNDNAFGLTRKDKKTDELAYKLGQANVSNDAFDASKVGVSTFLIGAPNMYNAYGPNIDFYYRASFIDKWGHESVPSPLPSKGISPLDSADDCIQINFSESFFRFDNTDIETIRLYRYGGDSSEFLFLRDIPMPDLTSFPLALPASGTGFSGSFERKSPSSSFYLLKTYYNISKLRGFSNSHFDLVATPSGMDGSWRVNQLSESETPSLSHSSTLTSPISLTDTTVTLVNATSFVDAGSDLWPTPGVIKVEEEYISYTAIEDRTLTGCVRGENDSTVSEHIGSEIVSFVNTAAGTNYGVTGYASGEVAMSNTTTSGTGSSASAYRFYPPTGWSTTSGLNPGLPVGTAVVFSTTGIMPVNLTAGKTYYIKHYGSGGDSSSFEVSATLGGTGVLGAGATEPNYVSGTTFSAGTGVLSLNRYFIRANNPVPKSGNFSVGNHDGQIQIVSTTTHGLSIGDVIRFSTSGVLPSYYLNSGTEAVVSTTTDYYVRSIQDTYKFKVSHTLGGIDTTLSHYVPITPGSGVHTWEEIESGKNFLATYTITPSTGAIASVTTVDSGSGYPASPDYYVIDPAGGNITTTVGTGATFGETFRSGTNVSLVEWELEMEHRNQDTTTLVEGISAPWSGSGTITVADTSVFPTGSSTTKILIGNEIFNYTGKTSTTFTGVTHNSSGGVASTHSPGVLVLSYKETYANISFSNASIEINSFGYRDKSRTPVASLHYMQEDNWPPLGLEYNVEKKQFFETESADDYFRYIKAVGSMYFAALDSTLKFSRYGTPEYWPLDAVVTLDSEIRWIEEHAGEGIVFTTNSVYRVRGTDPKAMIAFRVPDAKGLKDGYEHTVSEFNGGLLWLTASDGIAMYQGGKVNYLTRNKHKIGDLVLPYSCVADGVYWLFQKPGSGVGYRLELATGELRLAQTSIEAYYAYFAKALGLAVVVTKDDAISDDTTFVVEEIGAEKVKNISWKSKKIDAGEPAIPKALGSIAIVYEALSSSSGTTFTNGIRGQALAASLLGLDPADLDAGDLVSTDVVTTSDLYDIFTKYDQPDQAFTVDIGGGNLIDTERRTIIMPVGFDTSTVAVGDRIWNEFLADNTVVQSLTTAVVDSITHPAIVLDKEPLRSGEGTIYWGNLPLVEIYLNEDDTPSRVFTLPPGDTVETQSMDLYLNDLKRFRTISVGLQGDVRVQGLSLRHYPLQAYQSQTLHHSADVFYKGIVDFRVMLDGNLIYRKELNSAGDDFKEERIYLPASSFGQRAHYMNESRTGMIESVKFNGAIAA